MVEELEELEEGFEKVKEEESASKKVISWITHNIKFLLLPGSRLEELSNREFELERVKGKRKILRRFKSVLTITGIVIVFAIVTLAVFGQWIALQTFEEALHTAPGAWNGPSDAHPLGQTRLGYDVLARLIYGARSSLTIALPAISLSVVGGILFGMMAAFYRGWVDSLIMRVADVFLAFPGLILALVVIAISGRRNISDIMLVYGFLGIPWYACLIRGSVLQARELPYVQAAKVAGAGNWRIMFRHILPNCIQPIIISFTFNIGTMILSLAALSFLGFSDPTIIEWGNDINNARGHLYDSPYASLWPGFIILISVLGFMLIGDGLRDALDPRLKNL